MTLDQLLELHRTGRGKDAAKALRVQPTVISNAMCVLRKCGFDIPDGRAVTSRSNLEKAWQATRKNAQKMPTKPNPHYDPSRPGTPEWWKSRGL